MERYVECESRGLTLRGMLHVPDQRPGKVPFVILFHGFCDDRNEINFVHTELSRRLCERGIASVRFDFAGSGDSDGRFEDMTVSSEVEDGLAILDYVKSLDFVDQSRIAIHGLSMGGCVASMVAGLRDADVCALSLWCPAPDVVYNMKHKMLCGVDVSDIEEKGYADYEGLRVGLGFYQDALELDPYAGAVQGDLWRPGGIPGGPWRGAPIQILCVSGRPDGLGSGIPDPGAAGLNGGLLRRRGRGPAPPYNLEGRNENG